MSESKNTHKHWRFTLELGPSSTTAPSTPGRKTARKDPANHAAGLAAIALPQPLTLPRRHPLQAQRRSHQVHRQIRRHYHQRITQLRNQRGRQCRHHRRLRELGTAPTILPLAALTPQNALVVLPLPAQSLIAAVDSSAVAVYSTILAAIFKTVHP